MTPNGFRPVPKQAKGRQILAARIHDRWLDGADRFDRGEELNRGIAPGT